MATEKQITLIRKLLALGESPFLSEAKAAQKKAAELIIKYDVRPRDLLEVPPQPQPRCPGCPNCQPRGGVDYGFGAQSFTFSYTGWFDGARPGSTTTFHVWWEEA